MNRISVLFFLVGLCFSYLFIHEIGKLRIMCGIPLIWSDSEGMYTIHCILRNVLMIVHFPGYELVHSELGFMRCALKRYYY